MSGHGSHDSNKTKSGQCNLNNPENRDQITGHSGTQNKKDLHETNKHHTPPNNDSHQPKQSGGN